MRKALLLSLTLACPAASQSVVQRDDGAIDFASLDQQALVPAPDPLLERAPTPASADEVAAAVNDAFLKDLMQLREVMLHVLDKGPQLGLGVVHKWIRDNDGLDQHIDVRRITQYASDVQRQGGYPVFMRPRIVEACAVYLRERIGKLGDPSAQVASFFRCAPVACPSLGSARTARPRRSVLSSRVVRVAGTRRSLTSARSLSAAFSKSAPPAARVRPTGRPEPQRVASL